MTTFKIYWQGGGYYEFTADNYRWVNDNVIQFSYNGRPVQIINMTQVRIISVEYPDPEEEPAVSAPIQSHHFPSPTP